MSESEENRQPEEVEKQPVPAVRRSYFAPRNFMILVGGALLVFILVGLIGFFSYRYGYFDNYIKTQFVAKMNEIGVVFDADVFRVRVNPLTLELRNATFNDKLTGEKLFRIGEANLGLSVKDLYAWQLSRDISIDTTDLKDVEAWVKFDADGKSNFSNLKIVESEGRSRVNFLYSSIKFSVQNGVVHFGDITRKIDANANNIRLFVEPENYEIPDEQKRYKFDFTSTDSNVVYDGKPIEPVDVASKGIVDGTGAEITELKLKSPLGEAALNGTVKDWKSPKYNLNADSQIDLVQVAELLPNGTVLRGFGNFKGNITGEGETYRIDGEVASESLAAANIRLKGLQMNAVVDGDGSIYTANGKAVAEMLTFEDFRIDLPQMVGNVRGNGTDFKWVGELQAAAAKTSDFSLGKLFVSDAVAEYKDNQFIANLGTIRAAQFLSADAAAQDLIARNIKINNAGGTTTVNAPNLRASVVKAEGAELRGVNAGNLNVVNRNGRTDATASNLTAERVVTEDAQLAGVNARNIKVNNGGGSTDLTADNLQAKDVKTEDARLGNVTAQNIKLRNRNGATDITAGSLQAGNVQTADARLGSVRAGNVNVAIRGNTTNVNAGNLRVAKVETDAAILGSLNVAGVRLSIRDGRIEGTSNDFNAGTVTIPNSTIDGGGKLENVQVRKPVFVLESSGRYRASLDMSVGGGVLGSVRLGAARASVMADSDKVALNNLNADVMEGKINGDAVIALNNRTTSRIDADFTNLDLGKLLALQGGKVVPIAGTTNGKINLTFAGTNFKNANGTLTADFVANAGTTERGLVPVNGRLGLRAVNGLFDVDYANLNTERSTFNATGRFDLNGSNSNLNLALNSADATEIERIIRVLNLSPELENQLNEYQASFAGNLKFNGTLTGNISNPTIDGRAELDSLSLRGRELGSLATNIFVSPSIIELRDGVLRERGGGNVAFNVSVPQTGTNNISVQADLNNVNTGNLLAALPVDLPEALRDLNARTSGKINITGLPGAMSGTAEITSSGGSVAGQSFDDLDTRVTFAGNLVNIERFNAKFGDGFLNAKGIYRTDTKLFDIDAEGKNIEIARILPLFTKNPEDLPAIAGRVDLTAKLTGESDKFPTYNINFAGVGQDVTIADKTFGTVNFSGNTANRQLNANLTLNFEGQQQVVAATLNFADENLPFRAETVFNNTDLAPFIALIRPADNNIPLTGRATGKIYVAGNLYQKDINGKGTFTTDNLRGSADFTQLALVINETPFTATDPLTVRFDTNQITVERGEFGGGGSNITVNGTIGLRDTVASNLTVNGKLNLRVLNILSPNTFFGGAADVAVRVTGAGANARISGTANLENSSLSTFIGNERLNLTRINGQVLFTSNQIQIENMTGYLGGGKITASGGAVLSGLSPERFRLAISGQNVTAPIMDGFLATADADVEVTGYREGNTYNSLISGRVFAKRSVYSKDIDLADVIGNRRAGSISSGTGSSSFLGNPRLDLSIEGRDALVVRNNVADLRASVSLRVSGDFENPIVAGRITANEGTLFFRNDRYAIQRGVLEFPPQSENEPVINLQAETEISGYQIVVNLVGSLTNTETLNATVRSNPALPQADVVSLITTGNLANTDTGIPTLAQSGINTAAEVITDAVINEPIRKATDKLFGLNKFEIDPIISGRRLSPTARLTVGRQINRNLAVTYSTNLSADQNQVLAVEYRVSNKISFVAQYEQRSLSNVTRDDKVFSFEVRLRKRF